MAMKNSFSVSRRTFLASSAAVSMVASWAPLALAEEGATYESVTSKALTWLASRQADDGSFSAQIGSGPTAMVITAMLRQGRTPADPIVAKGLKYLEATVQPSGGIHGAKSRLPNYETCVALVCFKEANGDGKYTETIKKADAWLRGNQIDAGDEKKPEDFDYGGTGYGGPSRPDLSNTSYLLDALKAAGASADDEAVQKALIFVSRCQNLESPANTTPFAAKVNDGGFYYTPVLSQQDATRESDANGGLRSYGSMTYHGLKSMIYAGLDKDDQRVKAALTWVQKHYDLTSNPGMGDAGLYYYYHTFAKALSTAGLDEVEDASGTKHNWRSELVAELGKKQESNGSWVNKNNRWMEGDAVLCTAFVLLALSYAKPKT